MRLAVKEFKVAWKKIEGKGTEKWNIKKSVSESIDCNIVNSNVDEQIIYYSQALKNTQT